MLLLAENLRDFAEVENKKIVDLKIQKIEDFRTLLKIRTLQSKC